MTDLTKTIPSPKNAWVDEQGKPVRVIHDWISNLASASIATITGTGIVVWTGTTPISRSVIATSNKISIANGSGVSSNIGVDVNETNLSIANTQITGATISTGSSVSGTNTGDQTNITGNAATATLASTVTTNANLTGPITSTGNATAIAAQTGTGSTFVMNTSPTLITPILGVAAATSINFGGQTLSHYDEGTFTPTFTAGTPGDLSVIYTNQTGTYTRIGRLIFIYCRVDCTPTYTTATGLVFIPGLPFNAGQNSAGTVYDTNGGFTWPSSGSMLTPVLDSGTSRVYFDSFKSASAESNLDMTNVVSGAPLRMIFIMTYTV